MNFNIENLYIFYLGLAILGLAIVLMALPTVLKGQIEEAAKKLVEERQHQKENPKPTPVAA